MRRAADLGLTQSLLSMEAHDALIEQVERFNLEPFFVLVDGAMADEGSATKAPRLDRHLSVTCMRLRRAPQQVVLIGDTADDADAAARVGMGVILVQAGTDLASRVPAVNVVASVAHAVDTISAYVSFTTVLQSRPARSVK